MSEHITHPATSAATRKYSTPTVLFWSILTITTFIRLVYALKLPLTGDEAYFWEWGRHPALGYYDHPPVAGWILWITRQIFGETAAAVRIPAVIAGTVVVIVVHRFTFLITGSASRSAMTGLLAMGIPVLSVLGVIYSTDTPVLAAGTLGGYLFFKAVQTGDNRTWFWTGVCFAIMLGSKFLGIPLIAAAGLYLLLNPEVRRYLKKPGPYIAGVITLLGIVPVIIWNVSNDWATFTFNFAARHSGTSFSLTSVLDYLMGQAFGLSPLVLFFAIPVLSKALPVWKINRELGSSIPAFFALVPFAGFLLISPFAKIGIHWPAVAAPFLVITLGIKLSKKPGINKTYIATTLTAWLITLLLFLLPLAPYLLPSDWAYPLRPDKINTAQLKKIMDSPAESGKIVGAALSDLEKGGDVFTFTRSYALSSLIAFYTPNNPEVTVLGRGSVHGRNHILWFDPAIHTGDNAIYVSYKSVTSQKDFLLKRFESLQTVLDAAGPEGSLFSVVKCYGYKGIR